MSVRLYHGSEVIVEKPEFGKGARHNDYGKGFYCTTVSYTHLTLPTRDQV